MATQYSVQMRDGRLVSVYSDRSGANIAELIRQAMRLGSNQSRVDEVTGVQEVRQDVPMPASSSRNSFILSANNRLQTPSGIDIPLQQMVQFSTFGSGHNAQLVNQRVLGDPVAEATTLPPDPGGNGGGGGNGNGNGGTFDFAPESGGVSGGMDTVDTPLSQSDSQSGRFAAYLRELGNRGFTSGLGRQLQERRFAPAQSAFFGEEALGQLTDPDRAAGTFEQFLRGAPAGLGGFGSRARTAFGNLAGIAGASPQPEFGAIDPNTGFATRLPSQDLLSEYQDPDFENSRIGENLSNLALAAARANVAPIVGNQLFRSDRFNPFNLRSQFQAQRGTGGSGNFVDFLQGKFGLGG